MRRLPFFQREQNDPFRSPSWRWNRAVSLVEGGGYFSSKRDDVATGIAVHYLQDLRRCRSDRRINRVKRRYEHLDRALLIWQSGADRFELEARILARQTDFGVGLEMVLPPATVQAYADLFYDIRPRISATRYIHYAVLGLQPGVVPSPAQLMHFSAYHHGPLVIEPWLQYLQADNGPYDLTTEEGRLMESISLFVALRSLPDDHALDSSFLRLYPAVGKHELNFPESISASKSFSASCARIASQIDLPDYLLPPYSYRPSKQAPRDGHRKSRQRELRGAA
jgi:hypothetical protein